MESLTDQSPAEERRAFAALALQGSERALQAGAYAQARQYATQALALLGSQTGDRATVLGLQRQAQIAAYLCADFEASQAHYAQLLAHPGSAMEMAGVHLCSINLLTMRGEYAHATALGLETLDTLGVCIALDQLMDEATLSLERYVARVNEQGYERIYAFDAAADPHFEMVLSVMDGIALPTFFTNPVLSAVLGLRAANFARWRCIFAPKDWRGLPLVHRQRRIYCLAQRLPGRRRRDALCPEAGTQAWPGGAAGANPFGPCVDAALDRALAGGAGGGPQRL